MSKIHYINSKESFEKTLILGADLSFDYINSDGERVSAQCRTIMDFIDAMESDENDIPMIDDTDVNAIFFDNPLNRKKFDTIGDLLNHCKTIIK